MAHEHRRGVGSDRRRSLPARAPAGGGTGRDRRPEAGHRGMQHPLQAGGDRAGPLLVSLRPEAPQGHRRLRGQGVAP
ncbi:MAG: hypothetical protein ACK559_22515, partial [bacterium]